MPQRPRPHIRSAGMIAAAIVILGTVADAKDVHADCAPRVFEVELAQSDPVSLAAEICWPDAATEKPVVQVLLHGGAYDRRYWDPPAGNARYSYRAAANARGYVTVNLDRLGYGKSTRPDGSHLTFDLGAEAVGEVLEQIATGGLGRDVGAIVLNGHSMGGIVGEIVAGSSAHVAALVVSGLANSADHTGPDSEDVDDGPPAGINPFIPASQDARFTGEAWADHYMTTAPGVRPMIFHADGTFEDQIPGLEEELRDTIAVAELRAVMSGRQARPDFAGPSVYFLGQHDAIACEGQDCGERFAGTDRHVIVPGAGHSINLSLAAPAFFDLTFAWLEAQGLAP